MGAHVNNNDGAVRIYMDPSVQRRKSATKVIGKATSATTMYPNDNFRQLYPALWEEYYNEKSPMHVLHYGMYLSSLSAGERSGVYSAIMDSIGPLYGNAMMDWAMFSIISRTNVAMTFSEVMNDQILFSDKCYSDSWYSDMFCTKIRLEDIERFKDKWLEKVKAYDQGVSEAWIAIDGSNADCDVVNAELPAHGKAKSRRDGTIVGYMYAVDSRNGLPLTYEVFNGNIPDTKALQRMKNRLKRSGIEVRGAIMDRIFCEKPALEAIESLGWDWIVMLKKDTNAHLEMLSRATEVKWNMQNIINRRGVFGVEGAAKLFKSSTSESCVCLYFDGKNGTDRSLKLIDKVFEAEDDIRRQIERGEIPPTIPAGMDKYLSVNLDDDKWIIRRDIPTWQGDVDAKGYYSIASNHRMSAHEMHNTYYLRDSCEKVYSTMGSQLGSDVTRVHSDTAITAKHMATFLAQIIRSIIECDCGGLNLDTSKMLKEMNRLHISLIDSNKYACVHDESVRQRKLLKVMGFSTEDLELVVSEINRRINEVVISPKHKMPVHVDINARRPTGRQAKKLQDIASGKILTQQEEKPKGKPGRPKGAKNKKTLEKEAELLKNGGNVTQQEKRKPGRPKGSTKNPKSKQKDGPKRTPGRPKGSKNKKTLQREARLQKQEKKRLKEAAKNNGSPT